MKIDAPNLRSHLKTNMRSLYIIHGDELLLSLEAADLIRRAAKYKGFEDRVVIVAENRFDWSKGRGDLVRFADFDHIDHSGEHR